MADLKTLSKIAALCREKMESKYGPDLSDLCGDASDRLKFMLNIRGIKAKVVRGRYYIDHPDRKKYPADYEGHFDSTQEMLWDMHRPDHYWVESGEYLIDVTADQFNSETIEPAPKVLITKLSNRHLKEKQ